MRTHQILLLAGGLTLAACQDSAGPSPSPSTVGTLVVSTASQGNDPDRDGYLLMVDGVDSLLLDPTDTSQIDLPAGQHTLRLLGMAEHCSVSPGTPLDVGVPLRGTTSVAFEVTCSVSGVRVTNRTTGLDLDPDGYLIEVDGDTWGFIRSNATKLIQLDPGTRTITLGSLAPNCTIQDPGSRTVTIVEGESAQVEFPIVCTATTGVIGVTIEASGESVGGAYQALLDGTAFLVGPGATNYLPAPAGDHVVSVVAPDNCTVRTNPQSVTVTAGGRIRDTVAVSFSVTCTQQFGRIRITAPTTGPVPAGHRYEVIVCTNRGFICPWEPILRQELAPNGTLTARYGTIEVSVELKNIPANCRVQTANPTPFFTVPANSIREVPFPVVCGS
jgi:hypothetical protein